MIKKPLTAIILCVFSTLAVASTENVANNLIETKSLMAKRESYRDIDKVDLLLASRGYLGVFGGGGANMDHSFQQRGTALYGPDKGGPLIVVAQSAADSDSAGFVGASFGYKGLTRRLGHENSSWRITPALEFEGYYLRSIETGGLKNPTDRLDVEHLFLDSFPMNTGVLLVNALLHFDTLNRIKFHPYVGGGVGTAILSITNATSTQLSPAEPGINHFNLNANASNWTFAAQAKAGLQYDVAEHWRIFAEYRFLFLAPTYYNFGSTQYPSHIPTTNWTVNFGSMFSNLGGAGIQYNF